MFKGVIDNSTHYLNYCQWISISIMGIKS